MRQLQKSPDFEAPALERGIQILRFLDHPFRDRGAAANAIMKQLKLPRATLYRILKILMDSDLVVQDAMTGRYRLGPGLVELGFYALRANPLANKIQPYLHKINQGTGQLAEAWAPHGRWGMILLDTYYSEYIEPFRFHRAGYYMPIQHQTHAGMIYLAFDAAWRLKEYQQLGATQAGQEQLWMPGAPTNLAEQCANIRKLGYAWGESAFWPGTHRVAVPVFNAGVRPRRVAFVFSVTTFEKEINSQTAAEWARVLQAQAAEFERKHV
jgi:DNA-binding IclR family transcriptional regulator